MWLVLFTSALVFYLWPRSGNAEPVQPTVKTADTYATREELKPLRLEYPPRFRACEPYHDEIEGAVKHYWGAYQFPDAWAAQLYQESLCDPQATSYVGASGIAQFMPRTWREVAGELNLPPGTTPNSDIAIWAGAYYQARMMNGWRSGSPPIEAHKLGQASYNAGFGNIRRSQGLCGGSDWSTINICLPQVTGRHATETRGYVSRISDWWKAMGGCAPRSAPYEKQNEWEC